MHLCQGGGSSGRFIGRRRRRRLLRPLPSFLQPVASLPRCPLGLCRAAPATTSSLLLARRLARRPRVILEVIDLLQQLWLKARRLADLSLPQCLPARLHPQGLLQRTEPGLGRLQLAGQRVPQRRLHGGIGTDRLLQPLDRLPPPRDRLQQRGLADRAATAEWGVSRHRVLERGDRRLERVGGRGKKRRRQQRQLAVVAELAQVAWPSAKTLSSAGTASMGKGKGSVSAASTAVVDSG